MTDPVKDMSAAAEEKKQQELAEEREKKRKEAYNYFVAAYYQERILPAEMAAFRQHLANFNAAFHKKDKRVVDRLAMLYAGAVRLAAVRNESKKQLRMFFSLDNLNKEEKAEITECLKEINLEEKHFAAIALAACGDAIKGVCGYIGQKVKSILGVKEGTELITPEQEKEQLAKEYSEKRLEEIETIRDKAILETKRVIEACRNGDTRQFAEMIGAGINVSCNAFSREEDKEVAMQWSMFTSELLKVLRSNPVYMEQCGLTKTQLHLAERAAAMGKIIKDGMKAIERMSSTNPQISELEKDKDSACVLMMDVITENRSYILENWNQPDTPVAEKPEPVVKAPVLSNK